MRITNKIMKPLKHGIDFIKVFKLIHDLNQSLSESQLRTNFNHNNRLQSISNENRSRQIPNTLEMPQLNESKVALNKNQPEAFNIFDPRSFKPDRREPAHPNPNQYNRSKTIVQNSNRKPEIDTIRAAFQKHS